MRALEQSEGVRTVRGRVVAVADGDLVAGLEADLRGDAGEPSQYYNPHRSVRSSRSERYGLWCRHWRLESDLGDDADEPALRVVLRRRARAAGPGTAYCTIENGNWYSSERAQ